MPESPFRRVPLGGHQRTRELARLQSVIAGSSNPTGRNLVASAFGTHFTPKPPPYIWARITGWYPDSGGLVEGFPQCPYYSFEELEFDHCQGAWRDGVSMQTVERPDGKLGQLLAARWPAYEVNDCYVPEGSVVQLWRGNGNYFLFHLPNLCPAESGSGESGSGESGASGGSGIVLTCEEIFRELYEITEIPFTITQADVNFFGNIIGYTGVMRQRAFWFANPFHPERPQCLPQDFTHQWYWSANIPFALGIPFRAIDLYAFAGCYETEYPICRNLTFGYRICFTSPIIPTDFHCRQIENGCNVDCHDTPYQWDTTFNTEFTSGVTFLSFTATE